MQGILILILVFLTVLSLCWSVFCVSIDCSVSFIWIIHLIMHTRPIISLQLDPSTKPFYENLNIKLGDYKSTPGDYLVIGRRATSMGMPL